MSEEDLSLVVASVWKSVGTEDADARDAVIFELYRQRERFREALRQIAATPDKGGARLAEDALNAANPAPDQVGTRNKAIEAAVNRGLAATILDDLSAGVEVMCKAGVPLEVSRRVLLHPASRRATDWRRPEDVLAADSGRRREPLPVTHSASKTRH